MKPNIKLGDDYLSHADENLQRRDAWRARIDTGLSVLDRFDRWFDVQDAAEHRQESTLDLIIAFALLIAFLGCLIFLFPLIPGAM